DCGRRRAGGASSGRDAPACGPRRGGRTASRRTCSSCAHAGRHASGRGRSRSYYHVGAGRELVGAGETGSRARLELRRSSFRRSGRPARAVRLPLVKINLPNALTLLRIFLVPFLVVVLLTKFDGREI